MKYMRNLFDSVNPPSSYRMSPSFFYRMKLDMKEVFNWVLKLIIVDIIIIIIIIIIIMYL